MIQVVAHGGYETYQGTDLALTGLMSQRPEGPSHGDLGTANTELKMPLQREKCR